MPALIAVDPGEAALRIPASEEPFDDIYFDATPEPATRLQFMRMPDCALDFLEELQADVNSRAAM